MGRRTCLSRTLADRILSTGCSAKTAPTLIFNFCGLAQPIQKPSDTMKVHMGRICLMYDMPCFRISGTIKHEVPFYHGNYKFSLSLSRTTVSLPWTAARETLCLSLCLRCGEGSILRGLFTARDSGVGICQDVALSGSGTMKERDKG